VLVSFSFSRTAWFRTVVHEQLYFVPVTSVVYRVERSDRRPRVAWRWEPQTKLAERRLGLVSRTLFVSLRPAQPRMETTEPEQSTSSISPEEQALVKDESEIEEPIAKKRKGKQVRLPATGYTLGSS
jgi:hypothetical protein